MKTKQRSSVLTIPASAYRTDVALMGERERRVRRRWKDGPRQYGERMKTIHRWKGMEDEIRTDIDRAVPL